MSRAANLAALHLIQSLDRWGRPRSRRGPADYAIELENLYRMEGHWALTWTRLGTVQMAPERLRHLSGCLDPRSYLRVLGRSRRSAGPATVRVVESAEPDQVAGRSIQVSDDYYGASVPTDGIVYPYAMHPWIYALGWHRRVAALRWRRRRRLRLFFAGVVNSGYGDRFDFPILTRPVILEYLIDTFRSDTCLVSSRAELAALRRTDRPIALVVLRGAVDSLASTHYLPRESYLRWLSRSDFALCPPGVFMPHSHNLIEAMAVGTIPVTNYPQYCRPKLVDGKTCLAFSTTQELEATIRRVLAASDEEVRLIRAEVAWYYDEELSPDGTARKLKRFLEGSGPEYPLVINREFAAARLWSEANVQGH